MKNNLQKLQTKSEIAIQTSNLSKSIALAFERTNSAPKKIEGIVTDILNCFKDTSMEVMQEAIKRGSLGEYGKTYGDISTQEICYWIWSVFII